MDSVAYLAESRPEAALRQAFADAGIPVPLRLKLALLGCVSAEVFGNLGADAAGLQTVVMTLTTEADFGEGSHKTIAAAGLVTAWLKCKSATTHRAAVRARLEEDLLRIGVPEDADYRTAFTKSHLDVL